MIELPWSRFPRWWAKPLLATSFRGGVHGGESMSALRVYLAIAASVDRKAGTVPLSWSQLETVTGLSRPMVSKGLNRSKALGLLGVDESQRPHVYRLLDDGIKGREEVVPFSKMPKDLVLKELPGLPVRGAAVLEALKLYVTLLTARTRLAWSTVISHVKIVEWTGMQPRHVKRAISMLVTHNLIYVRQSSSWDGTGHPHNEYQLLGFAATGQNQSVAASASIPENRAMTKPPVGVLTADTDIPF